MEGSFEDLFTHAPIAAGIVDGAGTVTTANAALDALLDSDVGAALRRIIGQQVRSIRTRERQRWEVERRLVVDGGGRPRHLALSFARGEDPMPVVVQVVDVTAAREREERLQRLAEREPLTNLWNRRRFEDELQRQLARCRRHGQCATLVLIDVDGLKRTNDEYGHKAGDALLRHVAGVLGGRIRASDAVARVGGDEFAVLLAGSTGEDADLAVAVLCDAVGADALPFGDETLDAAISAGYVTIDDTTADADAAFVAADAALYAAKATGRGCAVRAG